MYPPDLGIVIRPLAWPQQNRNGPERLDDGSIRLPGKVNQKGFRRSGSAMSHHSPRNVIVVNTERALLAARDETIAMEHQHPSVDGPHELSP